MGSTVDSGYLRGLEMVYYDNSLYEMVHIFYIICDLDKVCEVEKNENCT